MHSASMQIVIALLIIYRLYTNPIISKEPVGGHLPMDPALYEELARAEPPVYGNQLKKRGRKPKAKVLTDSAVEGESMENTHAKKVKKNKNGKKGKGKGKRAGGKKGKGGKGRAKKGKKGKGQSAMGGEAGMSAPCEMAAEMKSLHDLEELPMERSAGEEAGAKTRKRRTKAKRSSTRAAKGNEMVVEENLEESNQTRNPPKKRARKGKAAVAKAPVDAPVEPLVEPEVAEVAPPPAGFSRPPIWVTASNVYSNMYRRAQSGGYSKAEVQAKAKQATQLFRESGIVSNDLLSSFRGRGKRATDLDLASDGGRHWYINDQPEYQPLLEDAATES